MGVLSRGVRNAFRNGVRTIGIVIILGLSIGLALTMLVAYKAVGNKIDSVKSSIGNTITISPAGFRGFAGGGGNPLTADQLNKVKSLPHVASLTETMQDRLDSTQTNLQSAIEAGSLGRRFGGGDNPSTDSGGGSTSQTFTPPVMVTGTNNLDSASSIGGGTIKLTSGKKFDPTVDANVAVIGSGLATKNNLVVGSTFQAYNATFAVVGIYDAGNTFANSTLVMPLPTVQRLSGQASEISGAVAQVDSISNLSTVTTSIKNTLGSSADVVSQQDTSNEALAPLKNIKSISLLSLAGAVVSGAIIIFLTMLMIVRERRREIGVLKAIGSSNSKITLQFMTEAVTFTGIGAVIGLLIGVVAGSPVTKMMVSSSSNSTTGTASGALTGRGGGGGGFFRTAAGGGQGGILRNIRDVQPVVGWDILLYGLAAAIAIAIIGTFIAAYLTTKVKPAEVMRSE